MDVVQVLTVGLTTALGPTAIYYALASIGLNVHYGYTGLLNFGQVGFMLVGAYSMAISVSIHELPLWAGVLIGMGAAVALALLLGFPTLRLRADYLAICTIAAAEILRFIVRSSTLETVTGGPYGIPSQVGGSGFAQGFYALNPIPAGTYSLGPLTYGHTRLWVMVVGWPLVFLTVGIVWLLMRSPWGRVVKSIREDEDAARALGKNVFAYKMQSLILGGVLGGLSGIMLALTNQSVGDWFLPQITFFAYAIVILGGAATVFGPVIGSVMFWFLITGTESLLRQVAFVPSAQIGAIRLALVGFALMLLMAFRPQGMFGNRREMVLDG